MKYSDKLKDPRWQKKRLEILKRDNCTCQLCFNDKKTLHIHHKEYVGEPWDVENKQLLTLCDDCHNVVYDLLHTDVWNNAIENNKKTDFVLLIVRLLLLSESHLLFEHIVKSIEQFASGYIKHMKEDDKDPAFLFYPNDLNIRFLKYVEKHWLLNDHNLEEIPCVYLIASYDFIKKKNHHIAYIGSTTNLFLRYKSHKIPDLIQADGNINLLYFLPMKKGFYDYEIKLIKALQPMYNKQHK